MNPVKKAFVRAISWYCTYSPIEPGKSRLQHLGLRILNSPTLQATSRDEQKFILKFPEDLGFDHIYFRHTYETGTLEILRKVLGPDDVVLDIGANMGWYAVHIARFAPAGTCHAFEPMPPTFERLRTNCEINGAIPRLRLNQVALGASPGKVQLHSFANLGHGHNSLSTLGRTDFTAWDVPMITLDSYIGSNAIDRVDLIKMDVEGAEMGVIDGASSIFALERPPIWIIELNNETAASFGYAPPDLLQRIASSGDYLFYRIVRSWDGVEVMSSLADYHHGDNAVCVPRSRLDLWKKAIGK